MDLQSADGGEARFALLPGLDNGMRAQERLEYRHVVVDRLLGIAVEPQARSSAGSRSRASDHENLIRAGYTEICTSRALKCSR